MCFSPQRSPLCQYPRWMGRWRLRISWQLSARPRAWWLSCWPITRLVSSWWVIYPLRKSSEEWRGPRIYLIFSCIPPGASSFSYSSSSSLSLSSSSSSSSFFLPFSFLLEFLIKDVALVPLHSLVTVSAYFTGTQELPERKPGASVQLCSSHHHENSSTSQSGGLQLWIIPIETKDVWIYRIHQWSKFWLSSDIEYAITVLPRQRKVTALQINRMASRSETSLTFYLTLAWNSVLVHLQTA